MPVHTVEQTARQLLEEDNARKVQVVLEVQNLQTIRQLQEEVASEWEANNQS